MQWTADCVWIMELYFLMVLSSDALISLLVPVDVDLHPKKVVDSQRALDHLQRPFHAASGKEQRVHGTERRLRRGETLPLRQRLCPNDGEGRIANRGHRHGVADLLLAQAEQSPSGSVVREGQLRCVVEAAAS